MTHRELLRNILKSAQHGKERTAEMSSAMAFEAILIDTEAALRDLDNARADFKGTELGHDPLYVLIRDPDPPSGT